MGGSLDKTPSSSFRCTKRPTICTEINSTLLLSTGYSNYDAANMLVHVSRPRWGQSLRRADVASYNKVTVLSLVDHDDSTPLRPLSVKRRNSEPLSSTADLFFDLLSSRFPTTNQHLFLTSPSDFSVLSHPTFYNANNY